MGYFLIVTHTGNAQEYDQGNKSGLPRLNQEACWEK